MKRNSGWHELTKAKGKWLNNKDEKIKKLVRECSKEQNIIEKEAHYNLIFI